VVACNDRPTGASPVDAGPAGSRPPGSSRRGTHWQATTRANRAIPRPLGSSQRSAHWLATARAEARREKAGKRALTNSMTPDSLAPPAYYRG
jgi:hypothetical protein